MPRKIIGYSQELFYCNDKPYSFEVYTSNLVLTLNPDIQVKKVELKINSKNHLFIKTRDLLLRKVDRIIVGCVDQTQQYHLFEFSGINEASLNFEEKILSFYYSDYSINSICSFAEPGIRVRSATATLTKNKQKNKKGQKVESLSYTNQSSYALPEIQEKQETINYRTPETPSSFAIKTCYDKIFIDDFCTYLEKQPLDWLDLYIECLSKEFNILRKNNQQVRFKNNIIRYFKIGWSLLTVPIGY